MPIMAVTAYAAKGDEERIRDAGAEGYVSKPISVLKFVESVAALLAAPRPDAPALADAEAEAPSPEPEATSPDDTESPEPETPEAAGAEATTASEELNGFDSFAGSETAEVEEERLEPDSSAGPPP